MNGVSVLWQRDNNKLLVKDPKSLEENLSMQDGVPFVFVQYETDEGLQTQKIIVENYIRRWE